MSTLSDAKPYHLSQQERDAIFQILEVEGPTLIPLAQEIMVAQEVAQPYFRRHRILCVQLISVMPPKVLHFSTSVDSPGKLGLLSVHIEHVDQLVAADPVPRISDTETAREYAELIDAWTRDSPYGELVISTFDEIPFYAEPDDVDRILIDVLRDNSAEMIEGPSMQQVKDGYVLTKWLVENKRLLRRQLHVQHDGNIARYENTVHDEIPCPPGKWWGDVDGRLVPVG